MLTKELICEGLLESLNEEDKTFNYQRGLKLGLAHRGKGKSLDIMVRDLEEKFPNLPKEFWKGYKRGFQDSWWSKFNSGLTAKLGQLGYSLTRR